MGIQINGQTDNISATDGSLTVSGADLGSASASSLNISGIVTATGGFSGNLTGTASTATAAATAYGLSGSPTLSIGAGTASAPSISPSGDPNTGVFFPSADTVAIAEGGVEALRVDSSGRLLVGTSSAINNAHTFTRDVNNNALVIVNSATSGAIFGLQIRYSGSDPNSTSSSYLECFNSASSTLRAEIRSNGGLANFSANNANLSDINSKKDIIPAAGTWDCIKEWEIVNYRYKDQSDDADLNLGVIAQQVAESCPEVITVFQEAKEATDDHPAQEERLGVKEQQMYWMAIKALQEAQVRIEALEDEVAALKDQ
jgi:hypothetical protein